jgi:hypothetical protein
MSDLFRSRRSVRRFRYRRQVTHLWMGRGMLRVVGQLSSHLPDRKYRIRRTADTEITARSSAAGGTDRR